MKYSNIFCCLGVVAIPSIFLFSTRIGHTDRQTSIAVPVTIDHSRESGVSNVVRLAEAFKKALSTDQVALLQRSYSKADAVRWSNFPQAFSHPDRVGLGLASLTPDQMTAFKALMSVALVQNIANEGYDELEGIRVADDYLGKATGKSETFGSGNYYIAFLGTPSETGLWELQYGGHHYAFSNTYDKGRVIGATPSFRGVEPMKVLTSNGRNYQPMEQERIAFTDIISAFNDADRNAARLTSTFDDVLLGPGQDGNFPVTKVGLKVGGLPSAQQAKIITAIRLYVNDLDSATAENIMQKYIAELPETYISYSGTGKMDQVADYIRIDGPGVWIEYAVQPSRDFANTTHPHSIWRDHRTDYGGN